MRSITGRAGLKQIAERVHDKARLFADELAELGYSVPARPVLRHGLRSSCDDGMRHRQRRSLRIRREAWIQSPPARATAQVGISLDETTGEADLDALFAAFSANSPASADAIAERCRRTRDAPSFAPRNPRYPHASGLQPLSQRNRDAALHPRRSNRAICRLTHSMIPLGSCTMKLNGTSEMMPVTWPEFGRLHPFAPADQTKGYQKLFKDLEKWLANITGFAAVSLQPNAGSQGEYAGLLAIRAYHESRGEAHRNVCLIPVSAHGTNPASAVVAGLKVVPVAAMRTATSKSQT